MVKEADVLSLEAKNRRMECQVISIPGSKGDEMAMAVCAGRFCFKGRGRETPESPTSPTSSHVSLWTPVHVLFLARSTKLDRVFKTSENIKTGTYVRGEPAVNLR